MSTYPTIDANRRTGRTTRLIDEMIQEFFNTGTVLVRDHYLNENQKRENIRAILRRLEAEHGIAEGYSVYVDLATNTIIAK